MSITQKCTGMSKNGNNCQNSGIYTSHEDGKNYCRHHILKFDETCVICLDNLYDICMLPCEHIFHKKCIYKWMKKNNTCPICRTQIDAGLCIDTFEDEQVQITSDIEALTQHIDNIRNLIHGVN